MEIVINEAARLLDRRNSGESKGGFSSESTDAFGHFLTWTFYLP